MRILISLAAVIGLSGCVAVPYDAPPTTYYQTSPAYPAYPAYGYAYPVAPVYAAPPVYVGPPVNFSFGLNYRSGGRGYGRHHHHHHHLDGFRSRGHGFHGGYRGGFRGR